MMEVIDGRLRDGEKDYGPATGLFVDAGESTPDEASGIIKAQLPHRIDYIYVVNNNEQPKIVGLESKKVGDLISSWRARRLQRQLRNMVETVDIPVLLVRPGDEIDFVMLDAWPEIQSDLVRFQMMGGYVWLAPYETEHLFEFLGETKSILSGNRNLRTIITGIDKAKPKGNKQEAALQAMLKGCGPVMAKKLIGQFRTVGRVLQATDTELRKSGATKGVVAQLKRLR